MGDEKKPSKINVPEHRVDDEKSPTSGLSSPMRSSSLGKQVGRKGNCLCSPTTHVGSFRCRYHRNSGTGIRRTSLSVGSALAEYNDGLPKISDKSSPRDTFMGV